MQKILRISCKLFEILWKFLTAMVLLRQSLDTFPKISLHLLASTKNSALARLPIKWHLKIMIITIMTIIIIITTKITITAILILLLLLLLLMIIIIIIINYLLLSQISFIHLFPFLIGLKIPVKFLIINTVDQIWKMFADTFRDESFFTVHCSWKPVKGVLKNYSLAYLAWHSSAFATKWW